MKNSEVLQKLLELTEENARYRAALNLVKIKYEKTDYKSSYEEVLVAAGMLEKKKEIQIFCDNDPKEIAYES